MNKVVVKALMALYCRFHQNLSLNHKEIFSWIFIALSIIVVIYFCITLTTQIQFETTNENTESGTSIPNNEPREFECPFCKSKILAPPAYSSRANLSLGNRTCSTCSANSLQTLRSPQETVWNGFFLTNKLIENEFFWQINFEFYFKKTLPHRYLQQNKQMSQIIHFWTNSEIHIPCLNSFTVNHLWIFVYLKHCCRYFDFKFYHINKFWLVYDRRIEKALPIVISKLHRHFDVQCHVHVVYLKRLTWINFCYNPGKV